MKLTKVQQEVYDLMDVGRWYSAAELNCRPSTLAAIRKKGLLAQNDLVAREKLGALFMPGVGLLFRREPERRGR